MHEVRMDRLTSVEYRQRIEKQPPAFLPVGALEQHGPHLAGSITTRFAAEVREVFGR